MYFYSIAGLGIHYANKQGKLEYNSQTDIVLSFFTALRSFSNETNHELEAIFWLGKQSSQLVFLPSAQRYIIAIETTRDIAVSELQLYLENIRDNINLRYFQKLDNDMFFSDITQLQIILQEILELHLNPLLIGR